MAFEMMILFKKYLIFDTPLSFATIADDSGSTSNIVDVDSSNSVLKIVLQTLVSQNCGECIKNCTANFHSLFCAEAKALESKGVGMGIPKHGCIY